MRIRSAKPLPAFWYPILPAIQTRNQKRKPNALMASDVRCENARRFAFRRFQKIPVLPTAWLAPMIHRLRVHFFVLARILWTFRHRDGLVIATTFRRFAIATFPPHVYPMPLPDSLSVVLDQPQRPRAPSYWDLRRAIHASKSAGDTCLASPPFSKRSVVLTPEISQEAGVPQVLPRPEDEPQPPAPVQPDGNITANQQAASQFVQPSRSSGSKLGRKTSRPIGSKWNSNGCEPSENWIAPAPVGAGTLSAPSRLQGQWIT